MVMIVVIMIIEAVSTLRAGLAACRYSRHMSAGPGAFVWAFAVLRCRVWGFEIQRVC